MAFGREGVYPADGVSGFPSTYPGLDSRGGTDERGATLLDAPAAGVSVGPSSRQATPARRRNSALPERKLFAMFLATTGPTRVPSPLFPSGRQRGALACRGHALRRTNGTPSAEVTAGLA